MLEAFGKMGHRPPKVQKIMPLFFLRQERVSKEMRSALGNATTSEAIFQIVESGAVQQEPVEIGEKKYEVLVGPEVETAKSRIAGSSGK